MKVDAIMKRNVMTCRQDDMLNCAAQLMWENDCGCVPVLSADDSERVVGIVTDRDVCMGAYTQGKRLFEIPVTTAMSQRVIACKLGDDLTRAELLMRENRVRRIPVVNAKGRLQGIISLDDIACEAEREAAAKMPTPQVSEAEVTQTLAGICAHRAAATITQAA